MGLAAYKKTIRESENPRQIERRILARVTHDMAVNGEGFDASETRVERLAILSLGLRDSIFENQRVWAALRHDLAEPGNRIPDALKASLISISLWVDRQTTAVLAGEGQLGGMVDINRNIIAGLAGQNPQTALQEV